MASGSESHGIPGDPGAPSGSGFHDGSGAVHGEFREDLVEDRVGEDLGRKPGSWDPGWESTLRRRSWVVATLQPHPIALKV